MKITISPYHHRARASSSSSPHSAVEATAPPFPPPPRRSPPRARSRGDVDDHETTSTRRRDDDENDTAVPSSVLGGSRRRPRPPSLARLDLDPRVVHSGTVRRGGPTSTSTSRRSLLSPMIAIAVSTFALPPPSSCGRVVVDPLHLLPPFAAIAADTVGKDADCDDASCLGVWDGLLADCPHPPGGGGGAGCVSSQDDAPGIFAEPWDYSDDVPLIPSSSSSSTKTEEDLDAHDDYARRMDRLILALDTTSRERGDSVTVLMREGRYLRAIVVDGVTGEGSVCEFYFTPDDTTVQFRLGSTTTTTTAPPGAAARSVVVASFGTLVGRRSLTNADRSERIRGALRYAKVPVLRNRRRRFFFVESDSLDGFGPGSGLLGPPEEMSPGEMMDFGRGGGVKRTRRGSDDIDPRMRIDWVESFPVRRPGWK